jgi:hypothetical protein
MLRFELLAECPQGSVRGRLHQGLHHLTAADIHFGRSAPTMGLRRDTSCFSVVFEQPAYTAHTDAKGGRQLSHRAVMVVIGLHDPGP